MTSGTLGRPRPVMPWRGAAAVFAAGSGVAIAAPIAPAPGAVQAGGLSVAGAALVSGIAAVRSSRRRTALEGAGAALASLIGPIEQTRVRGSRWRGGFVGLPARVVIDYAPSARAHEKEWSEQVERIVRSRLGSRLTVTQHHPRRNRLELRVPLASQLPASMDAARARAERNVSKLLGPTAKVTGVEILDGQICRIQASHEDATRFATSGYRMRIERTLSVVMPGRWRGVWDLTGDTVTFEQRPPLPDCIWVSPTDATDQQHLLTNYRQLTIPLCLDEDQREISWRPSVIPQLLIVGGTGSGKTSTAHSMVSSIARAGWSIWLADPKRVEFLQFRGYPNVQLVATTIEHQVAMIHHVLRLMQIRYEAVESGQAKVSRFEPLFVFLDEFAELRDNLLDWYPGVKPSGRTDTKPPTLKHVARLARLARTVRIHLIVLIQRPDAAFLSGEMRDNFGMRISMGRLSPAGAMMMWENASTGVTLPRGLTGRCMTTDESGRVVEAQAYRFPDMDAQPDSEQGQLLSRLRPLETRHERLLIVPPEEVIAESEDPGRDPDFWDYARAPLVRASERPDLDPLLNTGESPSEAALALLASPLVLLGGPAGALSNIPRGGWTVGEEPRAQTPQDTDVDLDAEYLEPQPGSPRGLVEGDLILVDEDLDHWAVLEIAPEESLEDPDSIALFWRDHDGEEGVLVVDADTEIPVRRPVEEQFGEPLPDD